MSVHVFVYVLASVGEWLVRPDILARRRTIAKALGMAVEHVKPLEVYDMVATRQAHDIPLPKEVDWTPELLKDLFDLAVGALGWISAGKRGGERQFLLRMGWVSDSAPA